MRANTISEVMSFERRIRDALKAGAGGEAYRIIRNAEFAAAYELDGEHVGSDVRASLGFEAWRLHLGARPCKVISRPPNEDVRDRGARARGQRHEGGNDP